MERKLKPFIPKFVRYNVFPLNEIELEEGYEYSFGFKPSSKQANFLNGGNTDGFFVIVNDGTSTNNPTSSNAVARAFGTYKNGKVELWHISVSKDHAYNDSSKGQNWGHYGLTPKLTGKKRRWLESEGKQLTIKNHENFIKGSANPYAVYAIYAIAKHFSPTEITQNQDMPCAQLFHKDYDHTIHPAIQLIYSSLNFKKSAMGNYIWPHTDKEKKDLTITDSFKIFLKNMVLGKDTST